jgi:hypothetical protein
MTIQAFNRLLPKGGVQKMPKGKTKRSRKNDDMGMDME